MLDKKQARNITQKNLTDCERRIVYSNGLLYIKAVELYSNKSEGKKVLEQREFSSFDF